jgi:hypothetical protein
VLDAWLFGWAELRLGRRLGRQRSPAPARRLNPTGMQKALKSRLPIRAEGDKLRFDLQFRAELPRFIYVHIKYKVRQKKSWADSGWGSLPSE